MPRTEPEFQSVEALVDHLLGDERETVTRPELQALRDNLPLDPDGHPRTLASVGAEVVRYAAECGLVLTIPDVPVHRNFRTLHDNPHNLWAGNPCSAGSGWEQISGFAGRNG